MQIHFSQISNDDVYKLQEIALQTFRDSYEHLNTPENFLWYIDRAFTIKKLLEEIGNENSFFYFVQHEGNRIGYLKLNIGTAQTEEHPQEYLEIERIYLDKNFQGNGIGKQMLHFANSKAKAFRKLKLWLGVWDQNPSAIAFYKREGFVENGSHIFRFGSEDQTDIIMERNVMP